jgi:RimJ/RimL family protein N-acetyltransferase
LAGGDDATVEPEGSPVGSEPVAPVRPSLPLPSPPLVHPVLEFSLRPWGTTVADGEALVAAWADPQIARFTAIPERRDVAAANRWIAKEEQRRTSGRAIDLVISELGVPERIWGEVGLVVVEPVRRWAEIGYWVAPAARNYGVATAAVTLVAGWATRSLPIARIVARTHPDNPASAVVAQRAGFTSAGSLSDGTDVWTLDAPTR